MDIDLDSSARNRPKIIEKLRQTFGYDKVLNICTFRTEGTKSVLLTICRGLGISSDVSQNLTALIPCERGQLWSFKDCIYGNKEKGRDKVTQLINELEALSKTYNFDIISSVFKLEGLICGRSIHASGVYIFKTPYTDINCMMKAPNGEPTTQWSMEDSDWCGGLKFDALTTNAEDKLEVCMDLLLRDGAVEDLGSVRANYNAYLHPDALEYEDKEVWRLCNEGRVMNLFQFESAIGEICMEKGKPHDLKSMALLNSIMRLVGDGEQAIDRYVRIKSNPQEWYDEMELRGLNKNEVGIMEDHLKENFGCCADQESMMLVLMDKRICNFNLVESNLARKIVAKKKTDKIAELKNMVYDKGRECGNRVEFLEYIWDICIVPSLGYSFSQLHTLGYSCIGLQEMNLVYRYNPLYWDCACLTVNAQAIEEEEEDEEEGEETTTKKNKKTSNYDKIAKAIGDVKKRGTIVSPPYVNKAKFSFYPDINGNQIVYSLKAIADVSDDTAQSIVQNQPYSSLKDFISKVEPKKKEMIALIKSGALDEFFGDKTREEMLKRYIASYVGTKSSLTLANLSYMSTNKLIPKEYSTMARMLNFKKYVTDKSRFYCVDESTSHLKKPKQWYLLDDVSQTFFEKHLSDTIQEGEGMEYESEGIIIRDKELDKAIKDKIKPLCLWMTTKEAIDLFNNHCVKTEYETKASGNPSKWEMETLCAYLNCPHELAHVDAEQYIISNYEELSETPKQIGENKWKGASYPIYELSRVTGTILATNKTRHTVTILDQFGNVFDIKMHGGAYANYSKQISVMVDGKKKVIEKSWLKRGNLIMAYGYRQDNQFRLKRYKNSPVQHTLQLITKITDEGTLILQEERARL